MSAKMLTNVSRIYRSAALVLIAVSLQTVTCNQAWATDNPFPESSTAFSKIQEIRQRASDLTMKAMDFMGIRYKRGGNTPENGLDCSGFVRLVFKDAVGENLPRTAAEISRVGENVDQKDLQPGDLVFYNTLKRGFSHVGIYLGDNKFIHSPSAGGQVRVESMDLAYWKKRFNGARRINDDSGKQ
ncbi:C40 family peptidase [Undibacterium sp. SXout20W]|uniref:C40 family peptidase n=1 Tax=Undibacterium sp. SXout20W TaxID=3413051 RepID=UPI003BF5DB03